MVDKVTAKAYSFVDDHKENNANDLFLKRIKEKMLKNKDASPNCDGNIIYNFQITQMLLPTESRRNVANAKNLSEQMKCTEGTTVSLGEMHIKNRHQSWSGSEMFKTIQTNTVVKVKEVNLHTQHTRIPGNFKTVQTHAVVEVKEVNLHTQHTRIPGNFKTVQTHAVVEESVLHSKHTQILDNMRLKNIHGDLSSYEPRRSNFVQMHSYETHKMLYPKKDRVQMQFDNIHALRAFVLTHASEKSSQMPSPSIKMSVNSTKKNEDVVCEHIKTDLSFDYHFRCWEGNHSVKIIAQPKEYIELTSSDERTAFMLHKQLPSLQGFPSKRVYPYHHGDETSEQRRQYYGNEEEA
ncbi:hypothetical protein OQB17_004427 [Salmonella enterica]|nr:hypothetical protein [Salmonella enterica]